MNKRKTLVLGATALTMAFAAAACSDAATGTAPSSTTVAAASPAAEGTTAHNGADVLFAQMMIPHHTQAIEMSDLVLAAPGVPEPVTALATRIKAAQGPEIDQLTTWLGQWGEPTGMPHEMPGHDMPGMGGMEGMMSEEDMQALAAAQGTEAARLFLGQMIAHHEGAVEMAKSEIEDGQFPDAVLMAGTIVDTQQQEIDTMRQLLTTL